MKYHSIERMIFREKVLIEQFELLELRISIFGTALVALVHRLRGINKFLILIFLPVLDREYKYIFPRCVSFLEELNEKHSTDAVVTGFFHLLNFTKRYVRSSNGSEKRENGFRKLIEDENVG